MKLILERIGITHSSTLRLKEKQEERGSCQTLWVVEVRMKIFTKLFLLLVFISLSANIFANAYSTEANFIFKNKVEASRN